MLRYAGGQVWMAHSEATGYIAFPPPRGWDDQTRISRKFGKMKRQLARLIQNSQYPPF